MKRKILSFLMASLLMFSCMGTVSFAAEERIFLDVSESSENFNAGTGDEDAVYQNQNGKYISFNNGDYQVFDFNIEKSGDYVISVYAGLGGTGGPVSAVSFYDFKTNTYTEVSRKAIIPNGSYSEFAPTVIGTFSLKAGANRIKLSQTYSDIHLNGIEIMPEMTESIKQDVSLSADSYNSSDGESETIKTSSSGNYSEFASGDWYIFEVDVPYADEFEFNIYSALRSGTAETEVYLYNEQTGSYEPSLSEIVNANGNNSRYVLNKLGKTNLKRGKNKIKVLQKSGTIRLNAIEISAFNEEFYKKDVREASKSFNNGTQTSEGLAIGTDGLFFVSFNAHDTQDFNFYIEKSGIYTVTMIAGNSGTTKKTSLLKYNENTGTYSKVSEKLVTDMGSNSVFGETQMAELELSKGLNRLRLKQVHSDIHFHALVLEYADTPSSVKMTVAQSTEGKTGAGEDETVLSDSGTPYISFNRDDYQIFDIEIVRSGKYEISLYAGLGSVGPITELSMYNQETDSYDLLSREFIVPSGDLKVYGKTSLGEFNLDEGDVRLKFLQKYSDIHLNSIEVEYVGTQETQFEIFAFETENTTGTKDGNLLSLMVGDNPPERADLKATVAEDGNYEVTAFATECYIREPQISIWENNTELVSAKIPNLTTNDICMPVSLGRVNLKAGEHNFRVRNSGPTSSKFILEKIVFTKTDAPIEMIISDETYLLPKAAESAKSVTITDTNAVFAENGVLKYDTYVSAGGYYLCEPDFEGENKDIVITANEKVLSNGDDAFIIYLTGGENTITASAHEECVLEGISLKLLPDVTDEICALFVNSVNNAETVEKMSEVIDEYASYFMLDTEELSEGIFYTDAIYKGLQKRGFTKAEEIISELKRLSEAEKTEPCVALYNGDIRINALESGNLTLKVSSEKMRENLSVLVAIYDGGRLSKVKKGDYTGTENEIVIPLGQTEIKGTETVKVISLDSLTEISPVDIRSNIEAEIFVSPSGNDENDGITASVRTIKRAQEIVAEYTPSMTGDIIVHLSEGAYYEGETLVFDSSQSGKDGYSVIWKGDKATISGGVSPEKWNHYKGGIYSADLSGVSDVRNLYVNGYPAIKAKTESAFWIEETYKSNSSTLDFDGVVIKDEYFPEINSGAESLELVLDASWETQRFPVSDVLYDGENGIVILDENVLKYNTPVKGTALSASKMVYLENHLSLLDKPGEFYYERSTGMLYYYPLESENIKTAEIVAGTVEGLVSVKGTEGEKVQNIVFDGITFKYGAWNHSSDYGFVGTQSDFHTNTETGESEMIFSQFGIEWAKDITVKDCMFTCLGSNAVKVGDGAEGVEIKGNLFRDIAASGIQIGNFSHEGSETKARTRNVTVSDNAFVRCGFEYRSCSAISLYYVNNVRISHNSLKDLPYSGMTAGWGWGGADPDGWGNITIENNKIDTVMQNLDDGGGVYLLGHMRNSKIMGNYFNKVGRTSSSMYADSGTAYAEFTGNVSTNSRQWLTIANIGLHDVRVRGNYADTSRGLITSEEYINEGNVNNIDADNLPEEAISIVENAGLSEKYSHLANGNELPEGRKSMVFISPKISYYEGYKFEAEDCKSYTSGIVYANSYLGFNNLSSAVFDINTLAEGRYKVRAFVAAPGASSEIGVLIDGNVVCEADVPQTGEYANYRMMDIGEITLPAGTTELTLKSLKNSFHVDCFILEPIA